MMFNSSGKAWMKILLLCSAIIKGICGDRWDPLPADVRNIVSNNHLGEDSPLQVFAEYHALLPNYRGDYGVKSELVVAASEEPIYKGTETLVMPLYIPHGAVPLSVNQRRVRSGKADGIANMRVLRGPSPSVRQSSTASAVNRPTRRVVSPFRRSSSGSRTFPTAPAAYLGAWLKRRNSSSTVKREDNLEEAKKPKQKHLSQLPHGRKRQRGSSNDEENTTESVLKLSTVISASSLESSLIEKTEKESVRIKKITTRLENIYGSKSFTDTSSVPTEDKIELKKDLSITNETEDDAKFESNKNLKIDNVESVDKERNSTSTTPTTTSSTNLTTNSTTPSTTTTSLPSETIPDISNDSIFVEIPTYKTSGVRPVIRRRPISFPKHADEIVRKRMKPVVPTRNTPESTRNIPELTLTTSIVLNTTERNKNITTTSTPRSVFSLLRIRNITQNAKPNFKAPDWLKRRRESIMKKMNSNKQSSHSADQTESSESIIDRVLSSAANQNEDDPLVDQANENISNHSVIKPNHKSFSNTSLETSIRLNSNHNNTTNRTSTNTSENKESGVPVTESPSPLAATPTSSSSPYRQKIPLRVRRPIVSNPVKSFSTTLSYIDPRTTKKPPTTTTTTTTTTESTTTSHKPETKVESKSYDIVETKTQNEPLSTNLITTSTPKLPFTFSTNIPPFQKIQSHDEPINRNTRFPTPNVRRRRPPSRFIPLHSLPRMRSPQDIVLEKLSQLMKNATKSGRDNLDIIVGEIENLNKELASMGIHIIDAEFDGQKIKLKDQVNNNRSGVNLAGATTIRYVIPNTRSRSKTGLPTPQIIKHDQNGERVSNIETSPTSHNRNPIRTKFINRTQSSPTPSRNTAKPDKSFFTLRHKNESRLSSFSTSPSPSYVKSKSELSPSKPVSQENETKASDKVRTSPIVLKTTFEPETEDASSRISATTTLSSNEVTRTRSTLVSITSSKTVDNKVYTSTTATKVIKNTTLGASSGQIPVNPTAHLRPSFSKVLTNSTQFAPSSTRPQSPNSKTKTKTVSYKTPEEELLPNAIEDVENAFPVLLSEYEPAIAPDLSQENASEANSYIYLIGILGILPCAAAVVILYRQRHKREKKSLPRREERAEGYTPPTNHTRPHAGHNDTLDAFPGYIFEASPVRDSHWELSRSKLRLTSVLGEGNFGIVWKAEARNLCDWDESGGPTVLVAVKGVKEGAGAKEKSDLLRELSIMQHLGQHLNIVTLLGCCTTNEPYHLVMEYVMFGKLLTFLREQRSKSNYFNFSSDSDHLTSRDLAKFASQVANGCEYLQSRGVIHRDLAARNILVDHNKICKIADFGLARSVKDTDNDIYEQKSKGPLPIRWMSPESLFMNIFAHKSDVWSFGILCWEIVTLGSTPYPGISAREVMRRVREGYRLERPEHCRPEFYRIVTKCWHQDLNKRASFSTVKDELRNLLDNHTGWIDLENFQESTYYSMHENNEEKL